MADRLTRKRLASALTVASSSMSNGAFAEGLGEKGFRHQQFCGEQVGLDFHLIHAPRRHGIAHQHRERLVDVHLLGDPVAVQDQVAAFVGDGKAAGGWDGGSR